MLWIPCSMIEWSRFHAAWRNGTLLNAGDFMQHDWMQWIPAAWLNALYFLQLGPKHPDLMQWIFCSMSQNIPIECSRYRAAWLNAVDFMQHGQKHPYSMQRIPCSVIECSGFHALCLNAVESMQPGKMHPDWMQWIPCSMIECSGFHAAW